MRTRRADITYTDHFVPSAAREQRVKRPPAVTLCALRSSEQAVDVLRMTSLDAGHYRAGVELTRTSAYVCKVLSLALSYVRC